MGNVTSIKKQEPVDPQLVVSRTLWSARALNTVFVLLDSDLKVAQGGWTKRLTEASQAMNEPLRLEVNEEKLSGKEAKRMLLEAREHRRERDELEEEKREDIQARKRVIAGFKEALTECLAISGSANSEQMHLYDGQAGVPGMGWASAITVQRVYAAIKLLDERGEKLPQDLTDLMVDLGTAGIEPVALALSAGEAVDNDVEVPEANDQDDGDEETSTSPSVSAPQTAPPPF